mgnify:CR=1 FL=1
MPIRGQAAVCEGIPGIPRLHLDLGRCVEMRLGKMAQTDMEGRFVIHIAMVKGLWREVDAVSIKQTVNKMSRKLVELEPGIQR